MASLPTRAVPPMPVHRTLVHRTVRPHTIPRRITVPEPGAVVEVRYLYAYAGGSLFQPTFLGERDDVKSGECVISQLKYRRADEEDEG